MVDDDEVSSGETRRAVRDAQATIRALLFAVTVAGAAAMTFAAPARAASVATGIDICAALRNGTSLSTIEATLEARGYSAPKAGVLTGNTIRQHCPDQAAKVMAQLRTAGA